MTSIRLARRFPAVLAFAVLVSLLAANLLPPLAEARTTHVTQDDDPVWSGEGKPHDWDSPEEGSSLWEPTPPSRRQVYPNQDWTWETHEPQHVISYRDWTGIALRLLISIMHRWI